MTHLNADNKSNSGTRQVRSVRTVSVKLQNLRQWIARWQDNSFWWWFRPTWKRNPGVKNGDWSK